jgi:glucosamine--fructose-6-phosphate aminotransferase (isomerizing)
MQKEIFEQPEALANTLEGRIGGSKTIQPGIFGADSDAICWPMSTPS